MTMQNINYFTILFINIFTYSILEYKKKIRGNLDNHKYMLTAQVLKEENVTPGISINIICFIIIHFC